MKMLQKCKAFLEVPDFEERMELGLAVIGIVVSTTFVLSALAHLDNLGDVIVRVSLGGAMLLGTSKLAMIRIRGLKAAKEVPNG